MKGCDPGAVKCLQHSPNVTSLRCVVRCDSPERLEHEWLRAPSHGVYILDQMRQVTRPPHYQIILNSTQYCCVLCKSGSVPGVSSSYFNIHCFMLPTFPCPCLSAISRVSNIVYPVLIIIMKLSVNPSPAPVWLTRAPCNY